MSASALRSASYLRAWARTSADAFRAIDSRYWSSSCTFCTFTLSMIRPSLRKSSATSFITVATNLSRSSTISSGVILPITARNPPSSVSRATRCISDLAEVEKTLDGVAAHVGIGRHLHVGHAVHRDRDHRPPTGLGPHFQPHLHVVQAQLGDLLDDGPDQRAPTNQRAITLRGTGPLTADHQQLAGVSHHHDLGDQRGHRDQKEQDHHGDHRARLPTPRSGEDTGMKCAVVCVHGRSPFTRCRARIRIPGAKRPQPAPPDTR
jgi:hypothetical protein